MSFFRAGPEQNATNARICSVNNYGERKIIQKRTATDSPPPPPTLSYREPHYTLEHDGETSTLATKYLIPCILCHRNTGDVFSLG